MQKSLKAQTFSALSWSFAQEFAQRLLQFGITIFLARLLAPAEFGLVAMLAIFIAVAQALLDGGFGSALIQRKGISEVEQSSVFYFNVLIGCVIAGLLWLTAPAIATFYNQPALTSLARAISVVLVINSFVVVQNALMVKRLDFKKQATISVAATAVSGGVALAMAWRGFGVWSLIGQQIANSVTRACLLWTLNSWRPALVFRLKALKEMFTFGSRMVGSVLLNTIFENLNSLVIGKMFTAVELGYFNRAHSLQYIAGHTLGTVTNRVTFPVFSELQDDLARLRNGLRKAIATLASVQFPMMIGLAVLAEPLVVVLLTEKWLASVPYLQLLCFIGILHPLHLLNINVLIALGRTDIVLRLEVLKRILFVANILLTYHWGVLAMIGGQVVHGVIAYFLNSYYTKRLVNYSVWEQLRDVGPYSAASLMMGLSVALISVPLPAAHWGQLVFKVLLGVAVYFVICRCLRLQALPEIMNLFRRKIVLAN